MRIRFLFFVSCIICSLFVAKSQERHQSKPLMYINLEYSMADNHIHLNIVNKEKDTISISSSHLNGSNIFIDFLTVDEVDNICPANEVGLGTPYQQRIIELPPNGKYEYKYKIDNYSSYNIKSSFNRIRFLYNIKYFMIDHEKGTYELKFKKGEKFFYR